MRIELFCFEDGYISYLLALELLHAATLDPRTLAKLGTDLLHL